MVAMFIFIKYLLLGYTTCSYSLEGISKNCWEKRRQVYSVDCDLQTFNDSTRECSFKEISKDCDLLDKADNDNPYVEYFSANQFNEKYTFTEVYERYHSFYLEIRNNVYYALSKPQVELTVCDFLDINGLLGFDYIFNAQLTEKKYHRACEKVKKIIREKINVVNDRIIFQYIITLLKKPTKRDLLLYRRYPELISMLVDLINKFNVLSLEQIVLILVHLSVLKSNIYYTLEKNTDKDLKLAISTYEYGKNYLFKPGIYKHVEEIYKILNNGSSTFIQEYIKSLESIREKNKCRKINLLITQFRIMLFLINPLSLDLVKKFFDESIIINSDLCKFKIVNEECVVCCNLFLTIDYTFKIILETLKKIYNTPKTNTKFHNRLIKKYDHFLSPQNNFYFYLNISELVSLIYDTLNINA